MSCARLGVLAFVALQFVTRLKLILRWSVLLTYDLIS